MIYALLGLTGAIGNASAMQQAAEAQNQAMQAQVSNWAARANEERIGRLRSAGYSVPSQAREDVPSPPPKSREYAVMVQPSEHETRVSAVEERLAEIKAEGAARHADIVSRAFAEGSPYRGEAA